MGSLKRSDCSGDVKLRSSGKPSAYPAKAFDFALWAERLKPSDIWLDIWALIRPRLWLLSACFFLLVINQASVLVWPALSRPLIDKVMAGRQIGLLPNIVGAGIAASFIEGTTSYVLTQLLIKSGQRLVTDLRKQVQQHIGRLSLSFHDASLTGTLVARIMTDVESIEKLVGMRAVGFVGNLLTALFAFLWLLRINVKMTVLNLFILLVFWLFMGQALKTIRPIFSEHAKINSEVAGRLSESLGGIRVVKGYQAEESEANVFANGAERLLQTVISSRMIQSQMIIASTILTGVLTSIVMYIGASDNYANRLTIGQYVTYVLFLNFMCSPIAPLVSAGVELTESVAGLYRTNEILKEREEHGDPARTLDIGPMIGNVRFVNVDFAYIEDKPVLRRVSFESNSGTITALVGSSGSGKSTITSLICGFYTAQKGAVLIDGHDLATVRLNSFRKQLGIVPQETFLFNGTIRENVRFSRPMASSEEFLKACELAHVDEFAERFPDGYNTIVGERGVKLSGGQRQRISIARAIIADPRILILDEATSSLDSESEELIQQGLNYLMQGRTTFVIAHRLSTIRRADQILVIEDGMIPERGTHDELFMLRGRYFDLYTRQYGLETNHVFGAGRG